MPWLDARVAGASEASGASRVGHCRELDVSAAEARYSSLGGMDTRPPSAGGLGVRKHGEDALRIRAGAGVEDRRGTATAGGGYEISRRRCGVSGSTANRCFRPPWSRRCAWR